MNKLNQQIKSLFHGQVPNWELARVNYEGLKSIRTKTFSFGDFDINVQFNPARIISSGAKVDAISIGKRKCFLCEENRPEEQQSIDTGEYTILVNPYPIFPQHFTIPRKEHSDQLIKPYFKDMLELAEAMDDFIVFYNGPKCGASAPDHLHFQAGIKGFLPIETDFLNNKCCKEIRRIGSVTISHWPDYQRGIISLKSKDRDNLIECFNQIYSKLQILQPDEVEPMLNILAIFKQGEWIIHIFPRTLHRPTQYFETGERQFILSPASVDMGGVLITPREEDFTKISKEDIRDIFNQVCPEPQAVLKLITQL